jgi:hypothetical protein
MDASEQIPEAGELRPDQLEIGKEYRIVEYGRPSPKVQHKVLGQSLAKFEGRQTFHYMTFTIVAPRSRKGEVIVALFIANSPAHNYYNRYFQTAQDRIVTPFKQKALNQVFSPMGESTAHGLSDGWFKPNERPTKKSGGRKYKTRQTKLRRKNRTKKNRRRTHK